MSHKIVYPQRVPGDKNLWTEVLRSFDELFFWRCLEWGGFCCSIFFLDTFLWQWWLWIIQRIKMFWWLCRFPKRNFWNFTLYHFSNRKHNKPNLALNQPSLLSAEMLRLTIHVLNWLWSLTFSYDVQHHSKRGESSDHVEEGHCVLDGQTLFSGPVVQTTNQQRHEEGLETVDQ